MVLFRFLLMVLFKDIGRLSIFPDRHFCHGPERKDRPYAPNQECPSTEPCIQGHNGSGAVFFSGCNLRCVFCQNYDIAHKPNGMDLAPEDLGDWYIKLQEVGNVHNVNLITPEHVVPQVVLSILHAADRGLKLPIVYNTSAYDSLESLKLLDGLVDIYLPDFKAWDPETSRRLLKAHDYSATARESVREMHRQVGDLCFTRDGLAKRGLLVRHLVMPGKQDEGKQIMRWLADEVSTDVFVNIMEQYHPDAHVGKPKGRRRVSGERKEEEKEVEEEAGDAAVVSKADPGGVRYAEINRAASEHEISSIRRAAEVAGLWRFCDPPGHDGFNI